MKLKTKISAVCCALLCAAVIISCFCIVDIVYRTSVEREVSSAADDARNFYYNFTAGMEQEVFSSKEEKRRFAGSVFGRIYGSEEYALSMNGGFISNNSGFDPGSVRGGERVSENCTLADVGGKDYIIAESVFYSDGDTFSVYLVRDVSAMISEINGLILLCGVIAAVVCAAAAVIIRSLVGRLLLPVDRLKQSARNISAGDYGARIDITENDEIGALAEEFNAMADAVQAGVAALRDKNERLETFINDISHEIKTPVTALMLNADTLLNRNVPRDKSEELLSAVYRQAKRLHSLSRRLIELVLGGRCELKEEDVGEVINSAKAEVGELFSKDGISLAVNCTAKTLVLDRELVCAALINLLDNARKASKKGQTAEICAYENIIEVKDHGAGIPKEKIDLITEPFYMADSSRSKKSGGMGLGLSIVRRIADAHGAELEISSRVGHGTSVKLIFKKNDNKKIT